MLGTCVVGGGPAGLMASIQAADQGRSVLLIEKNSSPGKKLLLTGKGRCNLTSTLRPKEVIDKVFVSASFLYGALYRFTPNNTCEFFTRRGLKLKEERGRRIYPQSDNAEDVKNVLLSAARSSGVEIMTDTEADRLMIDKEGRCRGIITQSGEGVEAERTILAAGGMTYPHTGSDGSGFKLSKEAGHSLKPQPAPALVPLKVRENWPTQAEGLKLKNIRLSLCRDEEVVYSDIGEVKLKQNEIAGSLALAASCYFEHIEDINCRISLDLKPGLSLKKLDKRLQRDFKKYHNKLFKNSLNDLLPSQMLPIAINLSGVPADKRVHQIKREERLKLAKTMKNLTATVVDKAGPERAIITMGGVDTDEVNPASMESRLIPDLYFAGEVLAPAAHTGGHNLQIAFSTGYVAGK